MKVLVKLGILLSLLGLSSIIGEYIYVQRTVTEEVPYTVQVLVGYRFRTPDIVNRPSTYTVYNGSIDLRSPYTMICEDFTRPLTGPESLIISWSSTRDILLFAFMPRSNWFHLYEVEAWGVGHSTVKALLRGEPVDQSVLLTLQDFILKEYVISPFGCYRLNSSSGRLWLRPFPVADFKIVVVDLNSTEGTVNVGIDLRWPFSLEMRDEPIYREETRYRTEERTVEVPLFVTPRIEGVEGNLLGFASLLTGITLTLASSLRGRKPTG